jgi:histidinol-phosphate aminotransferase
MSKPYDFGRAPLLNPDLIRPDWTTSTDRTPGLIYLDKNENLDPDLLESNWKILRDINPSMIATYPDCSRLYQKLGISVGLNPGQLLLAAGSDGIIKSVFETFISPGDLVMHTEPTFAMYAIYARIFGAKTISLKYNPGPDGPVLLLDEVIKSIQQNRPRLICLPNPDSPTGTVFSPEALREITIVAEAVGALLLVDEAYVPFYENTCISCVNQFPNLIVARTFAKAWGLAGLRVGFGASNSNIIGLMHKSRPMYELNTLAVAVLESALDNEGEVNTSVRRLNSGKIFFLDAMKELGFKTIATHGNFCHVAFGPLANNIHKSLADLVLYRRDFNEPCLKGFSRFSSATTKIINPVIDRIKNCVINYKG